MEEDFLSPQFYEARKSELALRVGKRRFEHSLGVSKTALKLARTYGGVDLAKAKLAGLLHDWNKALKPEEQRELVARFNIKLPDQVVQDMPWLLHGPTAAALLGHDFPQISPDILQAIARHTCAEHDMSPIDMMVYVADLIEPSRECDNINHLRKKVGEVELEELFFQSFCHIFGFLVQDARPIHPNTVEVYNELVYKKRARALKGE